MSVCVCIGQSLHGREKRKGRQSVDEVVRIFLFRWTLATHLLIWIQNQCARCVRHCPWEYWHCADPSPGKRQHDWDKETQEDEVHCLTCAQVHATTRCSLHYSCRRGSGRCYLQQIGYQTVPYETLDEVLNGFLMHERIRCSITEVKIFLERRHVRAGLLDADIVN